MKKISNLVLLLSLLTITLFSCKKQDDPSPETIYDTLKVDKPYTDYTLKESTILTLDATMADAVSYLWTPGNNTTSMINITDENYYTVKITTSVEEFNYGVLVIFEGSDCFIPNSFTPNNDNLNDIWRPLFYEIKISEENYLLNIYDKENVKMYSTQNFHEGWDGYYNGNLMPADYYYYVLSYQTMAGETKSRNGMLQLVL